MIRLHAIPVLLSLAVTACSNDSNRLLPFEPTTGETAAWVVQIPKPFDWRAEAATSSSTRQSRESRNEKADSKPVDVA